jgi:ribosomal protein L29
MVDFSMKRTKFKQELAEMNAQELREKLEALRRDLFGLKLNSSTAQVQDYSQFKKIKTNIAQVLTYEQRLKQKATKSK